MIYLILNIAILIANVIISRNKFPKWEYYEDGIRFYNKDKKVTIENDKPLL